MGMFDYVNVEIGCPECGSRINDFQSKDACCVLEKVDPDKVDNFYSSCRSCGKWVEFSREKPAKEEDLVREEPFSYKEIKDLGFYLRGK